jgi:hypothetical protein
MDMAGNIWLPQATYSSCWRETKSAVLHAPFLGQKLWLGFEMRKDNALSMTWREKICW